MNSPQEFAELLSGFGQLTQGGFRSPAALATLVRTQGSTFRRAGARMLIFSDGSTCRGLSGGCPERDIVERARQVIKTCESRIVRYQRDSVFDPMIETGCGGEIEVLIEPVAEEAHLAFIRAVEQCLASRRVGFMATLVSEAGRCLQPRPQRMVWSGHVLLDEFADSGLSRAVLEYGQSRLYEDHAVLRMEAAAGPVDVMLETLQPPHALILIGLNAGSVALARLAVGLGWKTSLVDHRDEAVAADGLPANVDFIQASPASLAGSVSLDARTSVVVMTHHLARDAEYISVLKHSKLNYLGAIGSRTRAQKLHELTEMTFPHLRVPAGLSIGAETPEEIALSVAAEILAVCAGKDGVVLSTINAPIH